jgi:hypothetical protein
MEVGARRGAHFQHRTPYRLPGLLDHFLAPKGYDVAAIRRLSVPEPSHLIDEKEVAPRYPNERARITSRVAFQNPTVAS